MAAYKQFNELYWKEKEKGKADDIAERDAARKINWNDRVIEAGGSKFSKLMEENRVLWGKVEQLELEVQMLRDAGANKDVNGNMVARYLRGG